MIAPTSPELLQQAVDAVVAAGGVIQKAADTLGIERKTLSRRYHAAIKRGIHPTRPAYPLSGVPPAIVGQFPPRGSRPGHRSYGRKHMIISDVQAKKDVPNVHMTWIGQYLVDKKPDVVVCIGDFGDMPSLSSYDKGKASFEGRRYKDDIKAVHVAMDKLMAPLALFNRGLPEDEQYRPRLVLTLGNHEERILRAANNTPELEGTISMDDLQYERYGWEVYPFLQPVTIDGVTYAHYFTSGQMGRPVSSARALVTKKHCSCVMGHSQKTDIDMSQVRADGKRIIGLFSGCTYLHDEEYLGPQGNADRRQIWMLHEVDDGDFDPMPVSLNYLRKRYA